MNEILLTKVSTSYHMSVQRTREGTCQFKLVMTPEQRTAHNSYYVETADSYLCSDKVTFSDLRTFLYVVTEVLVNMNEEGWMVGLEHLDCPNSTTLDLRSLRRRSPPPPSSPEDR